MPGLVRLASLLGTQTSSPLARVLTRVILISLSGATPSRSLPHIRTRSGPATVREGELAACPAQATETKWPVLCSRGNSYLGGEETDQCQTNLPGLQQ